MKKWLHIVRYRLGQVCQQIGFVRPLTLEDYGEVARWLPTAAQVLFKSMSPADQGHSLRVCRGLEAIGCTDEDMLAAALLHDVGKAEGRVPFWTRPVIVVGKRLMPEMLKRLVVEPSKCRQEGHNTRTPARGAPTMDEYPLVVHGRGTPCGCPGVLSKWRRSLSYAWYHAEVGARLAEQAGLSEQAVLYIRTHHEPRGPAALLHEIDEVS